MATPTVEIPRLLTAQEASKYLRVCERTVYNLSAPRGPLACVRIGRRVLYSPADLAAFIEASRACAQTGASQPGSCTGA